MGNKNSTVIVKEAEVEAPPAVIETAPVVQAAPKRSTQGMRVTAEEASLK